MRGRGKTRGFVLSLLVVTVLVLTVGVAGADTYTWNFATPEGTNLGTTETFTSDIGGITIEVSGFSGVGYHGGTGNWTLPNGGINAANLIGQNGAALGVQSNGLIDVGEILQLNISNLTGLYNDTASLLYVSGATQIFGSNVPVANGSIVGDYLTQSFASGLVSIDPGGYNYLWLSVTPNGATVSIASFTADDGNGNGASVPEPSTLLLLGSGLLGLVGYGRKRMKK